MRKGFAPGWGKVESATGERHIKKQVARTAGVAVRVFSMAIIATVPHSIAVSKLRRPFLYDRCFSVAVRRPKR